MSSLTIPQMSMIARALCNQTVVEMSYVWDVASCLISSALSAGKYLTLFHNPRWFRRSVPSTPTSSGLYLEQLACDARLLPLPPPRKDMQAETPPGLPATKSRLTPGMARPSPLNRRLADAIADTVAAASLSVPTTPSAPATNMSSPLSPPLSPTEGEALALPAVRGLRNLGSSCYLNAMLQALVATPGLCGPGLGRREPNAESELTAAFRRCECGRRVPLPQGVAVRARVNERAAVRVLLPLSSRHRRDPHSSSISSTGSCCNCTRRLRLRTPARRRSAPQRPTPTRRSTRVSFSRRCPAGTHARVPRLVVGRIRHVWWVECGGPSTLPVVTNGVCPSVVRFRMSRSHLALRRAPARHPIARRASRAHGPRHRLSRRFARFHDGGEHDAHEALVSPPCSLSVHVAWIGLPVGIMASTQRDFSALCLTLVVAQPLGAWHRLRTRLAY